MPCCIYCRAITSGTERVDHPLLRALGIRADQGLPPGACCDDGPHGRSCNAYLADLDQHVCNQTHISSMIVLGGLIGHRGRLRRRMNPGLLFDIDTLQGRLTSADVKVTEAGLEVSHPGNPFDPWKFSRGLHRMALGAVAVRFDPEVALQPRYDDVRRYIRHPKDRRIWPSLQRITDRTLGNRSLPRWIHERGRYVVVFASDANYSLVYMNLFVDEFIVALDGDLGALDPDELAHRSELPKKELSRRPWLLQPTAGQATGT